MMGFGPSKTLNSFLSLVCNFALPGATNYDDLLTIFYNCISYFPN